MLFLFFSAGKGSKSSLHSTDDSTDNRRSAPSSSDVKKPDSVSNNKKKKSILKKSNSREKGDFRSTSNGSGSGSLSTSITKSYYSSSDPEREKLLPADNFDSAIPDHSISTTVTSRNAASTSTKERTATKHSPIVHIFEL